MEQIDWEHLLDNTPPPEDLNFFDVEVDPSFFSDLPTHVPVNQFSNPSPDSLSLSVDDIELLLLKDDADLHFLSDILLDSPEGPGEVLDVSDAKNSNSSSEVEIDAIEHKEENNNNVNGVPDDPSSKKRERQERNRDAALRSRERKKMYVKDLEMKSRYFEGECKRLGMLLQGVLAENQALRFSLQNNKKAFDASMTKQESAVLLLESLLLGSLLWFLGIACLLTLPGPPQPALGAVPVENVQGILALRKGGSNFFSFLICQSSMLGKRCKASRSRMKPSSLTLEVLL